MYGLKHDIHIPELLYYIHGTYHLITVLVGHRVQKNPKFWNVVPYDPVPYDPVPYAPIPYDQGALFGLLI